MSISCVSLSNLARQHPSPSAMLPAVLLHAFKPTFFGCLRSSGSQPLRIVCKYIRYATHHLECVCGISDAGVSPLLLCGSVDCQNSQKSQPLFLMDRKSCRGCEFAFLRPSFELACTYASGHNTISFSDASGNPPLRV